MNLHSIPRGKRQPMKDSATQLQILGLQAVDATTFENEKYRIERATDEDWPWLLTRRWNGSAQKLSSLGEAVQVLEREMIRP